MKKKIQVGIACYSDHQSYENSYRNKKINICSCDVDMAYHFDHLSIFSQKE